MKTKLCNKCNTTKSVELFNMSNSKTGRRISWCKPCIKDYDHNRHKNQRTKIGAQKKARRKSIIQWFLTLKTTLRCEWCSENHPACLTFHHTNPIEKETEVSQAVAWAWSKERILKEIEKCIVLCFNCHSRHHFGEKYENLNILVGHAGYDPATS